MATFLTVIALAALELTPLPQQTEVDDDFFLVGSQTPVVLADDATPSEEGALRALFDAVGFQLPIRRAAQYDSTDQAIFIGEPGRHASFDRRRLRKYGDGLDDLPQEGYRLRVWKKGAVIAGAGRSGTFYGIQTLTRLARQTPLQWPCLDLRDWPDMPLRGVLVKGTLSRPRLAALAALKCNLVVFDSPDFRRFDGPRAAVWTRVFQDARDLFMEPVPFLDPSRDAQAFLRRQPAAVEGRVAEDRLALSGDTPADLSHPHVIATETSPIEVTISGLPCTALEDFVIEPGDLEAPFLPDARPWRIRRVPGGVIPDGATVTVRYAYAPPKSESLCPEAPETAALLGEALARIVARLHPAYVHVGHDAPVRFNRDLRCLAKQRTDAKARERSLALMAALAVRQDSRLRLMQWRPEPGPDPILRLATIPNGGGTVALVANDGRATAYEGVVAAKAQGALGVLVATGDADDGAVRAMLEKAWSTSKPVLPWPEGLNRVFGAKLWAPVYSERFAALARALNRATLAETMPEAVPARFKEEANRLRDVLPGNDRELQETGALLDVLVRYLDLESAYARNPEPSIPRKLTPLVRQQAALAPSFDTARADRIIETIERQGLFVPASILFGKQLLYVRPGSPKGLVEAAPEITFKDEKYRTQAVCDLGGVVAPVARIDFETVGARRVILEQSADGVRYDTAGEWTAAGKPGVRGPIFPRNALLSRYLRITVESAGEQAVLREVRLFATVPSRVARCGYTTSVSGTAGRFSAVDWPPVPQVMGFRDKQGGRFTAMPTEIRLCRSRTHLYIGINARESRPEAMVAQIRDRDGALWEEESVEVLLRPADRTYRLVVNPLGARFDSEGRDPGWDGQWDVHAERVEGGWRALISLPLKPFGAVPRAGDGWAADFIRHRRNVRTSTSAWAGTTGPDTVPAGKIVFQ